MDVSVAGDVMGWHWHQLNCRQVICTSLQAERRTIPTGQQSDFLQARCCSWQPTSGIKVLKANHRACCCCVIIISSRLVFIYSIHFFMASYYVLYVTNSSATSHVPIHPWTTSECSGPVWPLCQVTGTSDQADCVWLGCRQLNPALLHSVLDWQLPVIKHKIYGHARALGGMATSIGQAARWWWWWW